MPPQRPEAVADVVADVFERASAAGRPDFFLDAFHPTQAEVSPSPGLDGVEASRHLPFRFELQVRLQFLVHLALFARAEDECAKPLAEFIGQPHSTPRFHCRTPFTAPEVRSHCARSAARRFSPAAVIE